MATKSCVLQLRCDKAKKKKKIKTIHHASERYGKPSQTMVHKCRDLTDCKFTCRVLRGLCYAAVSVALTEAQWPSNSGDVTTALYLDY